MSYTTLQSNGARSINKMVTFCGVLGNSLPTPNDRVTEIVKRFEDAVRAEYPSVTADALKNVRGEWFEWLLSVAAWNTHINHQTAYVAFSLPNIRQFDCAKLYVPQLFEMIHHLREEVRRTSNVQLISSNPDFVIIDNRKFTHNVLAGAITGVTTSAVSALDSAYRDYQDKCDFEAIRGYMAAKLSFRPDRRLQIPHEGSLMKALYVHLQTRQWITEPPGIKYYAMAAEVKQVDRDALSTVATHSITTVSSKPQSAVDEVFEIAIWQDAENAFLKILNP